MAAHNAAPSETLPVVLITDDDPAFMDALATGLKEAGYRVVAAVSREDAFRAGQKLGWKLDAVLIDVIMPGVESAQALAVRIQAENPVIQVIFISGFSRESLDLIGQRLPPTIGFLQKPFGIADLIALLKPRKEIENKPLSSSQKPPDVPPKQSGGSPALRTPDHRTESRG